MLKSQRGHGDDICDGIEVNDENGDLPLKRNSKDKHGEYCKIIDADKKSGNNYTLVLTITITIFFTTKLIMMIENCI